MAKITIDDGIEPSLEQFCDSVGVRNLAEIDSVSLQTGDNPVGFSAISQFKSDLPLSSIRVVSEYTGSFPTGEFSGAQWWTDASSFEVSAETLSSWPESVDRPRWLMPGGMAQAFQDFLEEGDLHGAWMTLNSSGWSFTDARSAIVDLDAAAQNADFSLLAQAWLSVADERAGSY